MPTNRILTWWCLPCWTGSIQILILFVFLLNNIQTCYPPRGWTSLDLCLPLALCLPQWLQAWNIVLRCRMGASICFVILQNRLLFPCCLRCLLITSTIGGTRNSAQIRSTSLVLVFLTRRTKNRATQTLKDNKQLHKIINHQSRTQLEQESITKHLQLHRIRSIWCKWRSRWHAEKW